MGQFYLSKNDLVPQPPPVHWISIATYEAKTAMLREDLQRSRVEAAAQAPPFPDRPQLEKNRPDMINFSFFIRRLLLYFPLSVIRVSFNRCRGEEEEAKASELARFAAESARSAERAEAQEAEEAEAEARPAEFFTAPP